LNYYDLGTTGWAVYKRGYICMLNLSSNFSSDYADGSTITTLPAGYRPTIDHLDKPIYSNVGTFLGIIRINKTGVIYPVFGKLTAGQIRDTFCYLI
jgi:hypothetical protein